MIVQEMNRWPRTEVLRAGHYEILRTIFQLRAFSSDTTAGQKGVYLITLSWTRKMWTFFFVKKKAAKRYQIQQLLSSGNGCQILYLDVTHFVQREPVEINQWVDKPQYQHSYSPYCSLYFFIISEENLFIHRKTFYHWKPFPLFCIKLWQCNEKLHACHNY